jgi:hypothetical protein
MTAAAKPIAGRAVGGIMPMTALFRSEQVYLTALTFA